MTEPKPSGTYSFGRDYFQTRLENCFVDFAPGSTSPDILVVTFEGAGEPPHRPDGAREPFGAKFYLGEGYSLLGFKPINVTWYRTRDVINYFYFLKATGFFDRFSKVVFTGGSMGGYASLAFSTLVPGAVVIALQPQSTLSPALVPWDNRWPVGSAQDWSADFIDGADCTKTAHEVIVVYDPFLPKDALQVTRMGPDHVNPVRIPFVGHKVGAALLMGKTLKRLMRAGIEGRLNAKEARDIVRESRQSILWFQCALTYLGNRKKRWLLEVVRRNMPYDPEEHPGLWMAYQVAFEGDFSPEEVERQWAHGLAKWRTNPRLAIGHAHYLWRNDRKEEAVAFLTEAQTRVGNARLVAHALRSRPFNTLTVAA